ncbi:MAG: hypothetical protein WCX30_00200 [Candidatus Paceibacterota bacterium]|jgi:hypothetical protein|nr:hypothetical protein [bacterium]
MNFEQEKTENSLNSKQPIFVAIILIALSGIGFYYFNQQIMESMKSLLAINNEPYIIPRDPDIKFSFLNSEEFKNLEQFPDYASFKEDDELNVGPARPNPFIPVNDMNQTTVVNPIETQDTPTQSIIPTTQTAPPSSSPKTQTEK